MKSECVKKKICWVTPDCFVDVDLPIIPHLLEFYDINWIILFKKTNNRFSELDFSDLVIKYANLRIDFVHSDCRGRSPKNIFYFGKVKRLIKNSSADLIYFDVVPSSPYILPLYKWLPREKTIFTAHDGRVTLAFPFARLIKPFFMRAFKSVVHVNMFSKYQASFFNQNFPGKDITIIPLALKDFGKATTQKRDDVVSFVFFGTVHRDKGLDLLIEAANQLVEEGVHGFKVVVAGRWNVNWKPEDLIRHPEIFELFTSEISNSEIPNLFTNNYFAVYPYRVVSQSGSIKCAYNYNTPVIVSNLPGFMDEMKEGIDGYSFISGDVTDLKRVMVECIKKDRNQYDGLCKKMKHHINETYSLPSIVEKYQSMFKKILSDE